MENKILVSITTPAFNREETIATAIESVLNQTYDNIEYIIMDGGSTDRTLEIAHSYEEAFKARGIKYTIVSEPDNGMYDAINKAVKLASGTIIGNVNTDDYYEPNAVEVIVREYEKEPYDMIYADLRIIRKGKESIKKAKLKKFASTRYWNHPTTFITKETYNKEQYRCCDMYDDGELMLRLRRKGYKIRVVNEVLSNFVFGGMSNEKSWKKTRERLKYRKKMYKDNGYRCITYKIDSFIIEVGKYILG